MYCILSLLLLKIAPLKAQRLRKLYMLRNKRAVLITANIKGMGKKVRKKDFIDSTRKADQVAFYHIQRFYKVSEIIAPEIR